MKHLIVWYGASTLYGRAHIPPTTGGSHHSRCRAIRHVIWSLYSTACIWLSYVFLVYYGGFGLCIMDSKAGKWLADGYFGSMWALLGDQDHKRDAYRMANVISNKPCTQESLQCDKVLSWKAVWGYLQGFSFCEINMILPLVTIAQLIPSYAPGMIFASTQHGWIRHGQNYRMARLDQHSGAISWTS